MFLRDNDMVECPYNKTHCMLRKRLQSHLLKCRVNYPDVELRKCPFNITHLIPEPEFTHHATNCPDRKLITQYKYDAPVQKEEEVPKHATIECDDNWDDTDVNDYNPKLYLDQSNIIRQPDGANRSERKAFIKKERIRLGDGADSSDENAEVLSTENKRQRDSIDSDFRETRFRSNSSTSPSTSFSKQRSRSPTNISKRKRSSSPTSLSRLYRDNSPHFRRYPNNSPPTSNHNTREYQYKKGSRLANNNYNSGRDLDLSNDNFQTRYDSDSDESPMLPAPPPPMISYPAPCVYWSKQSQPPDSNQ